MIANIRPHNERAAAVWGSGGSAYDRVSATIADALDHVVARLNPQPGEKCLDVATGTGWTARLLKARGADVTGVRDGVAEVTELVGICAAPSCLAGLADERCVVGP